LEPEIRIKIKSRLMKGIDSHSPPNTEDEDEEDYD